MARSQEGKDVVLNLGAVGNQIDGAVLGVQVSRSFVNQQKRGGIHCELQERQRSPVSTARRGSSEIVGPTSIAY